MWLRFRAGDPSAFNQLAERYYKALYNYATKFSKDPDFIRDCLQELFLELWHRRAHLAEAANVKVYLLIALRHKITKESRRLYRFQNPADFSFALNDVDFPIEHRLVADEHERQQLQRLHHYVAQLTKRQQEVIYYRFYQNLDNEAIAGLMDMSRPSVANLLYRSLKELRENWVELSLLSIYFL